LIGYFTSTSENLEGPNISWGKLPFDVKSLHSLEWSDAKIGMISNLEGQFTSLGISITLLTGLSGLEAIADQLNLFFSFAKMVRSKNLTISGLGPVERGSTTATI
jgi:hypothetical protein